MSNTTLPDQKTSTTVEGRNCNLTGYPLRFPELVASSFQPAYVARGSVDSPKSINQTKRFIKKAFEAQLEGRGYSLVEILSPCPTNWHLSAPKAMERIRETVSEFYPIGELVNTKEGVGVS